jgi:pyruvate/2-oxoacid:ferredoxin oxidoreductase alpha subunit
MHEMLHWAAGARLPIVMVNVNRALGPGWNIWADQGDSLSQRDTGWVQIYVEDNQEVLDSVIQGYRIAEELMVPVMICYDAFLLSHTYEPVDIPDQQDVDSWLPPYEPQNILDPENPAAFDGLVMPDNYMEIRFKLHSALERAKEVVNQTGELFFEKFERKYQTIEAVKTEDADMVLVTSSSVTSPARIVVDELRKEGKKIGLLKIRLFRPFPVEDVKKVLKGKKKAVVIDRNCSWGKGGIFADELRGGLYNEDDMPVVHSYVAGLGGKSITPELIREMIEEASECEKPERISIWKGMKS